MAKRSFVFYETWYDMMDGLEDEEQFQLFKAIKACHQGKEVNIANPVLRAYFKSTVQPAIEENEGKYQAKVERINNVNRSRGENVTTSSRIRNEVVTNTERFHNDNVSDNVNVNDNDNVNVNDNVIIPTTSSTGSTSTTPTTSSSGYESLMAKDTHYEDNPLLVVSEQTTDALSAGKSGEAEENSAMNQHSPEWKNAKTDLEIGFCKFWDAFPSTRKRAKPACWKKWKKIHPDSALVEKMLQTIEAFKKTDEWKRGFAPMPLTWLNQGRWEDDVSENARSGTSGKKSFEDIVEEMRGWTIYEGDDNGDEQVFG